MSESNHNYLFARGADIGQYRVVEPLGAGGMGEVYLVQHRDLHKRYALKILPLQLSSNDQFISRFKLEARVMADLEHPHIVRVHNFGEGHGIYYLVMDYVEGPSDKPQNLEDFLDQVIEDSSPLDDAVIVEIGKQLCDALAFAHHFGDGVIHRDLKPANILLKGTPKAGDPDSWFLKVADFGLAKVVGSDYLMTAIQRSMSLSMGGQIDLSIGDEKTMFADSDRAAYGGTSTRAILGTYDYMSPEQKTGAEPTPKTDLYATGVILYRLLTGRKPEGRWKLPSELGRDKSWDKPIISCMEPDPADRYASVRELHTDLVAIQPPEVVTHPPRKAPAKRKTPKPVKVKDPKPPKPPKPKKVPKPPKVKKVKPPREPMSVEAKRKLKKNLAGLVGCAMALGIGTLTYDTYTAKQEERRVHTMENLSAAQSTFATGDWDAVRFSVQQLPLDIRNQSDVQFMLDAIETLEKETLFHDTFPDLEKIAGLKDTVQRQKDPNSLGELKTLLEQGQSYTEKALNIESQINDLEQSIGEKTPDDTRLKAQHDKALQALTLAKQHLQHSDPDKAQIYVSDGNTALAQLEVARISLAKDDENREDAERRAKLEEKKRLENEKRKREEDALLAQLELKRLEKMKEAQHQAMLEAEAKRLEDERLATKAKPRKYLEEAKKLVQAEQWQEAYLAAARANFWSFEPNAEINTMVDELRNKLNPPNPAHKAWRDFAANVAAQDAVAVEVGRLYFGKGRYPSFTFSLKTTADNLLELNLVDRLLPVAGRYYWKIDVNLLIAGGRFDLAREVIDTMPLHLQMRYQATLSLLNGIPPSMSQLASSDLLGAVTPLSELLKISELVPASDTQHFFASYPSNRHAEKMLFGSNTHQYIRDVNSTLFEINNAKEWFATRRISTTPPDPQWVRDSMEDPDARNLLRLRCKTAGDEVLLSPVNKLFFWGFKDAALELPLPDPCHDTAIFLHAILGQNKAREYLGFHRPDLFLINRFESFGVLMHFPNLALTDEMKAMRFNPLELTLIDEGFSYISYDSERIKNRLADNYQEIVNEIISGKSAPDFDPIPGLLFGMNDTLKQSLELIDKAGKIAIYDEHNVRNDPKLLAALNLPYGEVALNIFREGENSFYTFGKVNGYLSRTQIIEYLRKIEASFLKEDAQGARLANLASIWLRAFPRDMDAHKEATRLYNKIESYVDNRKLSMHQLILTNQELWSYSNVGQMSLFNKISDQIAIKQDENPDPETEFFLLRHGESEMGEQLSLLERNSRLQLYYEKHPSWYNFQMLWLYGMDPVWLSDQFKNFASSDFMIYDSISDVYGAIDYALMAHRMGHTRTGVKHLKKAIKVYEKSDTIETWLCDNYYASELPNVLMMLGEEELANSIVDDAIEKHETFYNNTRECEGFQIHTIVLPQTE